MSLVIFPRQYIQEYFEGGIFVIMTLFTYYCGNPLTEYCSLNAALYFWCHHPPTHSALC